MADDEKQKSFKIGGEEFNDAGQTITRILEDAGTDGVKLMGNQDTDWIPFAETSDAVQTLIQEEGTEKYHIGGMLARGGMGMVYNAKDVNIRRKIAMKVMLPGRDTSTEQVVRFIEEAQITGQLEHPGIVPVYELGVDARGHVFYTMKLIKGHTLMDVLKGLKKGDDTICSTYTLNHLLNIFLKVCDAVAYANSKRVVHRDLKPDNIMIGEYGEVSVLDWGLAKVISSSEAAESEQTQFPDITDDSVKMREAVNSLRQDDSHKGYQTHYGLIMGTPRYMAPEQALGRTDEIDARTDVYALGAILYNILTLHSPVKGGAVKEQLMDVINGNILSPLEYGAGGSAEGKVPLHHCPEGKVPAGLSAVCMKAMSVRKGERYESVKKLQTEIDMWQNGYATEAEGAGTGRMVELFVKRHKPMISLAGTAVVIIIGLSIAFGIKAKMGESDALEAKNAAEAAKQVALQSEEALRAMSVQAAGLALDKAELYMKTDNLEAARHNIELSIKLDPENPQAWFTKGRIELMQLKFEAAEQSMKTYRELSKDNRGDDYVKVIGKLRGIAVQHYGLSLAANSIRYEEAYTGAPPPNSPSLVVSGTETDKGKDDIDLPALKKERKVDREEVQADTASRERHMEEGAEGDINGHTVGISLKPADELQFKRKSRVKSDPLMKLYAKTMADYDDPIIAAHFYNASGDQQNSLKMKAREAKRAIKKQSRAESRVSVKEIDQAFLEVEIAKGGRLQDFSALQGLPVKTLNIEDSEVGDLRELKDIPLEHLSIKTQQTVDFMPLNQMPLKSLKLNSPTLKDLNCVKGMELESLDICDTSVSDLTILQGMPLKKLILRNTKVVDLKPIENMELEEIDFRGTPVKNADVLLRIKSLTKINGEEREVFKEKLRPQKP